MNNAVKWTVPLDHPAFTGHFPGTPIFPGAMLLDTVLHTIAAADASVLDRCEISAVKFLSPARPGDVLVIQHTLADNGAIHFDVLAGLRENSQRQRRAGIPVMTSRQSRNQTSATWAHTPERGSRLMLRVMSWISMRLGRRAARVVLHIVAGYFLLFAPASRRASGHYLRRALGRAPRLGDRYRHFFTFAATIHDRIYLINRRFDLFDIEVHGEDTLRSLLAGGNGLFLMGAHLGSFEVLRAIGRKVTDLHVAMVMHEGNAEKINGMLAAINPQAMQDIIGLGHIDSMLKVSERLDEGCAVGMLADRTLANDAFYPVQILGTNANLPRGPFRMAAVLRRPVVFMTGLYLGGNRYAIHFDPLADFSSVARAGRGERDAAVEAAITRYAALLDQYCRKAPYNWFNFFDFWQPSLAAMPAKS